MEKAEWEGGTPMKRRSAALLLCVCLLFSCTACQTGQETLYSQAMSQQNEQSMTEPSIDPNDPGYLGLGTPAPEDRATPIPGDDLSGELTIQGYTPYNWESNIQTLANEFKKLHPQVKITIQFEVGYDEYKRLSNQERTARENSFYSRLRTEMAAGEANYILFDSGSGTNLTAFSRSGILEDLTPYIEKDFEEDAFYTPVLEAFQVDGKQTMLPMAFSYYSIYFDRDLLNQIGVDPDSIESVTTTQLLGWYDQAREINPELRLFYSGPDKDYLFPLERTAFMDLNTGESSFDSPEFINFLSHTSQILNEEPNLDSDGIGRIKIGLADDALTFQSGKELDQEAKFWENADPFWVSMIEDVMPFFAVPDDAMSERGLFIKQYPFDNLAGPYLLTNSKGNVGVMSYETFAIPSSMKEKELAWEFIKYCMGDREETRFIQAGYQWDYTWNIPTNRANWKQIVQRVSGGIGFGTSNAGVSSNFNGADVDQVLADLDEVLSYPLVPIYYYNVDVQDYLDEFYKNGLTTAEECAQKIQGRAEIWLNE